MKIKPGVLAGVLIGLIVAGLAGALAGVIVGADLNGEPDVFAFFDPWAGVLAGVFAGITAGIFVYLVVKGEATIEALLGGAALSYIVIVPVVVGLALFASIKGAVLFAGLSLIIFVVRHRRKPSH